MKTNLTNYVVSAVAGSILLTAANAAPHANDIRWYKGYPGPAGEAFSTMRSGDYVYTCGAFGNISGLPSSKNMARFNLQTELWEPMPGDSEPDNFVRVMHADDEGNIWVGGDFSMIGDLRASKIVRFNRFTGEWLPLRDGSTEVDSRGPSSGGVYAVVRSGDYVYIGGFIFNSDDPAKRFVRRFNIKTNKWSAVGEGLNNRVRALTVDAKGDVYAAGSFTASGATSLNGLAKWDGTKWTSVAGGTNGAVRTMKFDKNGVLYVGGDFTKVGIARETAGYVAAWDGSKWHTFNGGLEGGGSSVGIWGLTVDTEGRLYVGGDFDTFRSSGGQVNRVAAWVNGQWYGLGNGLGGSTTQIVNDIVSVGEDVYFAGVFSDPNAGPNQKVNFSRWNPTINFTGYTPTVETPIVIVPGAQGSNTLYVGTKFNSSKSIVYQLAISVDGGKTWGAASNPTLGFGNTPIYWTIENYKQFAGSDQAFFRVATMRQ